MQPVIGEIQDMINLQALWSLWVGGAAHNLVLPFYTSTTVITLFFYSVSPLQGTQYLLWMVSFLLVKQTKPSCGVQ